MNLADNNPSTDYLTIVPIKKERHVIIEENIVLSLSASSLKLYMIFRFESDYRNECSSINKKIKFFMNKADISRSKIFECLNELEDNGLIRRETKQGEQTKYWIADKLMYFKPKIEQPPVQNLDYPVQNLDYPVQNLDTITNNSFNNIINKTPPIPPQGGKSVFEEFWEIYPLKIAKKVCAKHWLAKNLDFIAGGIIEKLMTQITQDDRWLKGFIPNPTTYLNQERWKDEIVKSPIYTRVSSTNTPAYDDNDTSWIKGGDA